MCEGLPNCASLDEINTFITEPTNFFSIYIKT